MQTQNRLLALALLVAFAPCFVPAQTASLPDPAPQKRPMTFEDMMKMKRLGEMAGLFCYDRGSRQKH